MWLVCDETDMSGEVEQGHGKGFGRKHSSPGREVDRLVDGEVIGKKDSNKPAGSAQQCGIQDDRVWVGKQVGREK